MTEAPAILTLTAAVTGYGKKQVLFGVNLAAKAGKITAVIGPNGAGKSTVLKVAHGLLPLWSGTATYDGAPLNGSTPADRVRRGITFCPQGNRVFGELTVRENLDLGGSHLPAKEVAARVAAVLEVFPQLPPRLKQVAGTLSGGEQQMVSIARALVSKPKLLMLDEPSLGLSPNILKDVFEKIVEVNRIQGMTILIVEQKVRKVLTIADHVYSLKLGKVAFSGPPAELISNTDVLRRLFL
ncbi:MAG TPA: ABC transporter ATP-binding protein [Kiritimatiellia bacterium]|nr:ABC transporter ATP-binding protein [Kiritimatiellia bacterium]HSA17507.1 ABC transporter ATP-binding protein [Kiritimatiellia bacterium]